MEPATPPIERKSTSNHTDNGETHGDDLKGDSVGESKVEEKEEGNSGEDGKEQC